MDENKYTFRKSILNTLNIIFLPLLVIDRRAVIIRHVNYEFYSRLYDSIALFKNLLNVKENSMKQGRTHRRHVSPYFS